jgi:hypothetical protein
VTGSVIINIDTVAVSTATIYNSSHLINTATVITLIITEPVAIVIRGVN